jgi:hypothetical protein
MEYKPQDAMFNIDCNGEYVKNHKTLIIVRCRHLEINSYHGYKDFVMHNWKLFDMWSIISRIFFRTSMEMQSIMLEGALLYGDSILYQLVSKRLLGSSPWRSTLKLYAVIEKSSMNLFCYKMSDTEACDPLVSWQF